MESIKSGDSVRIVKNIYNHGFRYNTIVEIVDFKHEIDGVRYYCARGVDGFGDTCTISDREFELVQIVDLEKSIDLERSFIATQTTIIIVGIIFIFLGFIGSFYGNELNSIQYVIAGFILGFYICLKTFRKFSFKNLHNS